MIELMRSRNIIINNESFAKSALQNLSYYTLVNGYKESFWSVQGSDSFIPGTSFEQLYTMAIIDKNLSNVVLKYILYIESALKSRISYLVSCKYGVDTDYQTYVSRDLSDYLSVLHYSRGPKRNNVLKKFKQIIREPQAINAHQTNSLKHYIANHNHIPAWILITSMTLGDVILWYSIMKPCDKEEICNSFIADTMMSVDAKKEYVRKALDLIRKFRNDIAHSGRVFNCIGNIQLPKRQALHLAPSIINSQEYDNSPSAKSGLHAIVIAIVTLIPDTYLLRSLCFDLGNVFKPYKDTYIHGKSIPELFGLPDDIINRLNEII